MKVSKHRAKQARQGASLGSSSWAPWLVFGAFVTASFLLIATVKAAGVL